MQCLARTAGVILLAALPTRADLLAQRNSAPPLPTTPALARAVRAAPTAPKLDGVLDDPIWATAPRFGDFVQRDPDEGRPATEPTEFQVAYTDDALYVAVRARDSRPSEIAALLTRRDDWSPSDEITVMIDSHHDRRTGFSFTVNAAGVKRDAYLFNDYETDTRWDAVWDARVTVDAEGWAAEFRIPFSQLRFGRSDNHTFGFNVSRRLNRLNETQFWRLVPKQASGYVSLFGELTDLAGIRPPRRLELLPYSAASSYGRPAVPGDPFRTGTERRATLGGDFKVGLSSALTLTGTINPDFGQVEADPAVVNLSAFESFFAERRPFFTEGLDIFRFRIADGDGDGSEEELFYTRRIGRAPQGWADPRGGFAERIDRTTILGAAKLSGKTRNGWTIGVLGAVTDREDARVLTGLGQRLVDAVEPATTYGVARVAREFRGGLTQIGFFGTTVQRSLPEELRWLHSGAYTAGLSWSHRFAGNTYEFSGRVVGSRVEGSPEAIALTQRSSARYYQRPDADYVELDSTRTSLSGYTFAMNGGRTAGNWRWNLNLHARSPGFEVNDAGYMREADRISGGIWVNRRWLTPGPVFRRFNLNFNQWTALSWGGERRNIGGNVNANYTLRNYWGGWMGVNRNLGGLSTTALRGGPGFRTPPTWSGWFGIESDSRKTVRGGGTMWMGAEDQGDNWHIGGNLNLSWRPASNLDLTVGPGLDYSRNDWQYLATATVAGRPEYLFGEIRQSSARMTLRSNATFSPTLSLQVYAQPFVASGRYLGFRRVATPRADRFQDQFDRLTGPRAIRDPDGAVRLDLEADGVTDVTLANPDFTVLSFRSNVVLRWEYRPGSTLFLVWQHGRNGYDPDGRFRFGDRLGDIFRTPGENVLLVKLNYWLSL